MRTLMVESMHSVPWCLAAATARGRCQCSRRHEQVVQVVCAALQHKGHMHHKLWE